MPSITIESEVRPYLNSLIENGASYVWLQNFYQLKIKNEVGKAIDALPVKNIYKRMALLRLFIDNEAVNYPKKHQKLMPIRVLFRHSDSLASDLQNRLSREILLKFRHAPNDFLAQNAEKILETLLNIQILLEMRERFEVAKSKVHPKYHYIIDEQQSWLKKEIHSRVPVTQRTIKTDLLSETNTLQKWDFSKGPLGYDTGPGNLWYFFHGETKLALFLQREILNFIVMGLTFKDRVNDIAKQKFSFGKILLYFPMTTFVFFLQLMNLAFSPYRLFRSVLAEINQLIYRFVRMAYEYILPTRHCNKPVLYSATLMMQVALFTGLLLTMGLPYFIVPFAWTTPLQAALMTSTLLVAYNGAMLTVGLGKYLYELKQKSEITKPPIASSSTSFKKSDLSLVNKKHVYLPSLDNNQKIDIQIKPFKSRELVYVSTQPKIQTYLLKK